MSVTPPPSKQSQIKQCHHRRGLLFSLALPFFSLPQIEASSATKYNANTFFIMDFFFADLDLQQKKKTKKQKTQKNKKQHTHTKKLAKPRKTPESVCREGGGEEEKTFTEWDRLT